MPHISDFLPGLGKCVDGALTADLDLETAVSAGAREINAVDLTQPADGFRSDLIMNVLYRSLELLLRQQVKRDIERFSELASITVIRPRLDHAHTLASFGHIGHLIDCGLVTNDSPGTSDRASG